ncbi:hypothetical protein LHGZ1_1591 [Laribacter hongkongensis]|uniref:Uncharacterized protein n=1 Tax=Laribacter hongkongensis TaxID=168471 RepID=A0A248LIF0_9NEIS|nr:hypothetical protein LHGZ1_1591 [Laribacter hongkongensis]
MASRTRRSLSSGRVTSVSWPTASPPSSLIPSAIRCNQSARLAPSTTLAPWLASSLAVASPIPDEPPVMMTTLSLIMPFLRCSQGRRAAGTNGLWGMPERWSVRVAAVPGKGEAEAGQLTGI